MDGDGDVDLVMALGFDHPRREAPAGTQQIVWYENDGSPGIGPWPRHVIAEHFPGAFEATAADLDGDGQVEVVATAWGEPGRVALFKHRGDPKGPWNMQILKDDWAHANMVIVADLDGDGRLDVAACAERGWEFFSHGIYNTRYTYGMSEQQEREMILDSIDTIERHTGQRPVGYLAPALSHSEHTLDLFAEAGGVYTCDLFHDDQPTPVRVRGGQRFISIPYSLEMNDTIAYVVNRIEPRRYGQMLCDNFDRLYQEGATSGTVMCIPTHNYQVSCPHRLRAFEQALEYITGHSGVWLATGREIAEHFLANYYDVAHAAAKSHIARERGGSHGA